MLKLVSFFRRITLLLLLLLTSGLGLLAVTGCGGGWGGTSIAATGSLLIVSQPANQTVVAGQYASFAVTASGTAPFSYQWFKAGTAITGATSSTYTTPATAGADSGTLFTVAVSNTTGSATSTVAMLTVDVPPSVTIPPASQTVIAGKPATFSVIAAGTAPLSYQWFSNGTAISGAASATYTLSATVSANNGSLFTVAVSNMAGSVTSIAATLIVNTPPIITTQPLSQTINAGQTASFSVAATGTAPLTYQWFKAGAPIAGATSAIYTTPTATIANSGILYSVTVTNIAGSVTSNPAALTVNNSAPIASSLVCSALTPPYNSTITLVPIFSGGTAAIGSTGLGSSDVTSSATSGNSYTTAALKSSKTFTLTVTGASGATASASCTVTPTNVTVSPISPANITIAPAPQSFSSNATGGLTNKLLWTATGGSFQGDLWTPPSTARVYIITATSVDEPFVFVTTTVTLTPPVILTQPASQNLCKGSSATLSVTANYAASYQWNLNGVVIAGANSSSYFIPSAIAMDAGSYSVTVTNPAGSVTSSVAIVSVGSVITSNPVNATVFNTQTATYTVAASGVGPFKYQWYLIPPGQLSDSVISGATSSTYTTPTVNSGYNGAQYYATVTDACNDGSLTSTAGSLTEKSGNVPPTIVTNPIGVTVSIGTTVAFSVAASGTPALTYQWYWIPTGSVTGTVITGASTSSYTVPATFTSASNDQDSYYVIVSNPYGSAVSQHATLAVGNGVLIQVTNEPVTQYVNPGDSATFSVTATSNLPLTYQWYRAAPGSASFAPIHGATGSSYTELSAPTSDSGSVFYVVVSNGVTTPVTSTTAGLFVGALSSIGNLCSAWQSLGNATALSGCSYQLTASALTQHGEIVWPNLISTGNIQLSFTVAVSNPSVLPADGFAMVLGDPSLGATTTSLGATGMGLGAEGIPGFVLGFDTYHNPGDPPVPYLGVGRGETALWENPWFFVNTNIAPLAEGNTTVTHSYFVSIVEGQMVVTMDGAQVFSGSVTVPPVAYLYVTASTGASYEQTVISNLSATVVAPSN